MGPRAVAPERLGLAPEERRDIAAAPQHPQNEHAFILDPIDDEVLANGKAPQRGT